MSKDIKKALEHCIEWNCADCPNREELGSGETVCRGRLLPEVLEYVADLEAQIAEMQNKSFILYSMLYETLEKQGCENVASQIDQMTGWTYDKEADWLKGNRNYDQFKQQLAESENQCRECKHLNKKIELNIKNKLMAENCELQKQLAEKEKQLENAQNLKAIEVADELSLKLSKIHNQDKISFALEQLEKVKENIHYLLSFDYNLLSKVNEQFDNQIKQLNEME